MKIRANNIHIEVLDSAGVEEMGHDLPPGVVRRLLELMIPHFKKTGLGTL